MQTLWKVKSGKGVCVLHTTTAAKRPRMRGSKNRKIKAKRCGAPRGGQRAPINCKKIVINILEGQTLQWWRRGFDGRRPKSSNKKSSNAAESGAKQHKQQPRNSEGCPAEGGSAEVPEGWGPELFGPGLWGPRSVGAPKGGVQKISRFFFLLPPPFSFFFSLLESFRGIGGVIESRDPQMCTFGVLGLSCEAPAAPKPPGLHTTARAHFRVPAFKNTTEDTQRDTKERNGGRERGSRSGS